MQLALLWLLPTAKCAEHAMAAAVTAFTLPEQTLWRPRIGPMTDGPVHPMQTPFLNIRQAQSSSTLNAQECSTANQFPCKYYIYSYTLNQCSHMYQPLLTSGRLLSRD